jgi:hypothetical protein
VQIGFEEVKEKKLILPAKLVHLERAKLPPLRFLREFRHQYPLRIKEGDKVDVSQFRSWQNGWRR